MPKLFLFPLLLVLLAQPFGACSQKPTVPASITPRMRVIVHNDFSGDPDGLFQLAHLLLSPSVEIRAIIGSHLRVGNGFDNSPTQADNAAGKAQELMKLMKIKRTIPY